MTTDPDADAEAQRVRDVYARRAARGLDDRYAYWTPANLHIYQERERVLLRLLRNAHLLPLAGKRVLDLGCGDGAVLRRLLDYGAAPADLHGVDMLPERIERARETLPSSHIDRGDARKLPHDDASFDLVLAFTLLSSVAPALRHEVAAEMRRVLRPGGLIVLYDFWLNPTNRDATSVQRHQVLALFPGTRIRFEAVTLAPPIIRALAPLPGGSLACSLLEVLPFLKSHFLAAIRP